MSDVLRIQGDLTISLSNLIGIGGGSYKRVDIGAVRRWLETIDRFGISDDTQLQDCLLSVRLTGAKVIPIECAEHDGVAPKDALVVLHECE